VSLGAISSFAFTNVTANHTISAAFAINTYTLTVTLGGSANGSVTSVPSGISCGSTCAAVFDHGTAVTLTATPNTGSNFVGWLGAGCSGTGVCTVTMDAVKTVTALFDVALQYLYLPFIRR
jgi:hypothetical protein